MSFNLAGDGDKDEAVPVAIWAAPALTQAQLNACLDEWVAANWLRAVDLAVARLVLNQAPNTSPLAILALVFASHLAGQGHVCLDLAACWHDADTVLKMPPKDSADARRWRVLANLSHGAMQGPLRPAQILAGTRFADWLAALEACPDVIGRALPYGAMVSPANEPNDSPPFVRDGERLYLRRYWRQEQAVAQAISHRLQSTRALPDAPRIHAILTALFRSDAGGGGLDWQKIACAVALRNAFALITGGPGTGKTTTVVKFLMLTQMLALQAGQPPLRILLCAPTGKAAARLRQSLLSQMDALCAPFAVTYPQLRATLPDTVYTVHRLIGIRPDHAQPKFHAGAPLPADVVVIDEASMLGLALMAQTLAALLDHTQLIMLGDKDQLASVEPGAVLGELCNAALSHGGYTPALAQWICATTGEAVDVAAPTGAGHTALAEATVWLRHSHRFGASSAIAALAHCVNAGDDKGAVAVLTAPASSDCALGLVHDDATRRPLLSVVLAALNPWLRLVSTPWHSGDSVYQSLNDWAISFFAAHSPAQVLCALRHGPYGVVGLNAWIEQSLIQAKLIAGTQALDGWYAGRPVMVTRNDSALHLANGDVGLTLPYIDPELSPPAGAVLRVAFLSDAPQAGLAPAIRWINPNRLVSVETAFALTVHKAQGSEFDHSILVLPAAPNPVVTRALIYTAITRARSKFTLIAAAPDSSLRVLRQGVLRQVEPSGQLGNLLQRV
jgi:exodeoxyribonuclease V alpha subunit